jgi:GDP-4-dehydro-6-deoxy-D-mannose reductase
VRTFNIIGARQSAAFACSSFAKQIACIEKGLQPPIIHVGNLSSCRDFLDVRDVVRAYWLLLQKGKRGEVYNVCSEKAWSMEKILEFLLSLSPEKERIKIKKQKERMRVGDVPLQIGDASKIRKECGWCATVKVEESLEDLLNFWRRKEVLDGVGR